MTMDAVLAWAIENFMWASAAMLLVLAIRRPVALVFGAGTAYALWLIPLARLVAPPADWLGVLFATPLPSPPPLLVLSDDISGATTPPSLAELAQWPLILLAIWAGGALLFLGVQALGHWRFMRRLYPIQRVGDHCGVSLAISEAAEGPLALGLIKRRIIVPTDFAARYTPQEQGLALDHERYHHRRGDIFANHVALAVLALNWFNPVAWFGFRAFRTDQELSCDAAIIARATSPAKHYDYARALIKSASSPGLVSACPLNSADQLKRRLKMLKAHRRDPRRLLAGSVLAATLTVATLVMGAPSHAQEVYGRPLEQAVEHAPDATDIRPRDKPGAPVVTPRHREERRASADRRDSRTAAQPDAEPVTVTIERGRVDRCRNGTVTTIAGSSGRSHALICGEAVLGDRTFQTLRERSTADHVLTGEFRQGRPVETETLNASARRD